MTGIPDVLETELAALADVTPPPVGAPLHAVAVLASIGGDLDPAVGDPLGARRRRAAARRLAATAVLTAARVHGAFGDRPDVERAHVRVCANLVEHARRIDAAPSRALAAVAAAALALPPLHDDGQADWQLGAIAFVDERLLRALYDACVELAAVALRVAAGR